VNRNFHSERDSVASEISSGLMLVAIVVMIGLWAIAQLEHAPSRCCSTSSATARITADHLLAVVPSSDAVIR
jgi:hypothetical protein